MPRPRSLAALLLALVLGLVASVLVSAPASAVADPIIQGVAVDGTGRPILDVKVSAEKNGEVIATDLTYENVTADGDPQPGYFALHVTKGDYTVTLSKKGYETAVIGDVSIRKGRRIASLGEITLRRTSTTSAKLVDDSITVDEKGKVKVTVAPTGSKPTGKVSVQEGRKTVGSATLKAKHKGELTVTLDKLAKGAHDLKVTYGGSDDFAESTSGKLTLVVKAPKKKSQRPNALRYVG
jgi:hypothetical protein